MLYLPILMVFILPMQIAILIILLAILIYSCDKLVENCIELSARIGMSLLVISILVIALGTSLPELAVNVSAAIQDRTEITYGNTVGSNIANMGMVVGICAIICPIVLSKTITFKIMLVAISIACLLMINNQSVNALEGLALIILLSFLLSTDDSKVDAEPSNKSLPILIIKIIAQLALVVSCGWLVVEAASQSAEILGIEKHVVGISIIAISTSIPELLVGISAIRKKQPDIILGNIVGSNIFNITLVLGTAALIKPVAVPSDYYIDMGVMIVLVAMLTICYLLSRVNRIMGVVMFACYISYIFIRMS